MLDQFREYCKADHLILTPHQEIAAKKLLDLIEVDGNLLIFFKAAGTGSSTLLAALESYLKTCGHVEGIENPFLLKADHENLERRAS